MIYIKEKHPDDHSVEILVEGILDSETLPLLKKVCERHWAGGKKITLHLQELKHINREGRYFLHKVQNKGVLIEPTNAWDWQAEDKNNLG